MANEYLQRTPTSTGNRSVYTISGWFKNNDPTTDKYLFSSGDDGSNIFYISFRRDANNNNFTVLFRDGDTSSHTLAFDNNSFRDPGSWMHLVVAVNTTIYDSDSDRCKIFINGVRLTGWTTDQLANLNDDSLTATNALERHTIGAYSVNLNATTAIQISDYFLVDGQALTPDVFGFYKDGDGYVSAGSTNATDFRPGQWMPLSPSIIKKSIERRGGFGVNGFYLPMNDSSNNGADFHCDPNSIITLKGEDLPQPRNGAPTTSDAYVSQLRTDANDANLVLAVPGIALENTNTELVTNGTFDTGISGWSAFNATISWDSLNQRIEINAPTEFDGVETSSGVSVSASTNYTLEVDVNLGTAGGVRLQVRDSTNASSLSNLDVSGSGTYAVNFASGSNTSVYIRLITSGGNSGTAYFDNVSMKEAVAVRDYSADIKGSGTNKTLTANGNAGVGYELGNYYGSAMTFDGTGDALSISVPNNDPLFLQGDSTIELWAKIASGITGDRYFLTLISGGSDNSEASWYIRIDNSKFEGIIANGSTQYKTISANNYVADQWNHIVYEREGNVQRLFINGVCGSVTTYSVLPNVNNSSILYIGSSWNLNNPLDADIQDLRIYSGLAKYKGGFDVPKPYTPVGIEAFRATADTFSNNFATWNAVDRGDGLTLSDGNLSLQNSSNYRATNSYHSFNTTKTKSKKNLMAYAMTFLICSIHIFY